MTSMKEMGRRMHHMFATFVPAELFDDYFADLVKSEPDIQYAWGDQLGRISDAPSEAVARRSKCTLREGVRGAYVYLLFADELFLADHLAYGYQYVHLDEVWDMGVPPMEPMSDDVLAEIL